MFVSGSFAWFRFGDFGYRVCDFGERVSSVTVTKSDGGVASAGAVRRHGARQPRLGHRLFARRQIAVGVDAGVGVQDVGVQDVGDGLDSVASGRPTPQRWHLRRWWRWRRFVGSGGVATPDVDVGSRRGDVEDGGVEPARPAQRHRHEVHGAGRRPGRRRRDALDDEDAERRRRPAPRRRRRKGADVPLGLPTLVFHDADDSFDADDAATLAAGDDAATLGVGVGVARDVAAGLAAPAAAAAAGAAQAAPLQRRFDGVVGVDGVGVGVVAEAGSRRGAAGRLGRRPGVDSALRQSAEIGRLCRRRMPPPVPVRTTR